MNELPSAQDIARGGGPPPACSIPSDCPGGDDLRRGLLGELSQQDQADFERHILGCDSCQQRLDQLYDGTFLRGWRNRVDGLDRLGRDIETVAYVSSPLTPSGAGVEAGNDADAEFIGNQRFRIDRRIGSGGMGIVYQAYDRERRETIALKTFRRLGEEAALRLTHEFRALADLRHTNLVSLYELYADGDRRFFTMELLDGDDFLTHVRGPSPDDAGAARIARLRHVLPQLAAGLEALHAAGKLHCDIKPSNIMVTRDGRLVLVDFGLVTEAQPDEFSRDFVAGTAAYMSPEQAAGRALSPVSDWYSVGVMLFEALTGDLPYAGRTRDVMVRKQFEEPLPLDYWGRDLPDDLKALCAELLRVDSGRRPTGEEVLRRLNSGPCLTRAAAKEDGLPSPSPCNSDRFGRPSSRAGGTPTPQTFVGREAELSVLNSAFDRVAGGRAHVVLLRGPSGVGKTALAAEFFRQLAARADAVVLSGRCYEHELVPFKAAESLMESLVRYLQRQPEADVRGWCPPDLAAAVHILPALYQLSAVQSLPPVVAADRPELKRRAFAALRELLRRMAARRPTVCFIDDLQWGAADSPALFAEWLRGPNAPRLLFVGAYRDEAANGGLWLKTWREVERKSGFAWTGDELTVGPLADDEARLLAQSLARRLGGNEGADALAVKMAQHAMGHPLFVRELVEHACGAGVSPAFDCGAGVSPAPDCGTSFPDTSGQAGRLHHNVAAQAGRLHHNGPPSMSDIIGRRLAALDAEAYRLLEAVAVAGYPITLERAYRAAQLPLDRRAPLADLVDANLARTIADDRLGKLVPYHDSVRETLVSRSSAEALRDAHRRLAEAAAAESPVDDEALVLHYQGAGEAELAARHASAAGDRAARNLAFDLAIRCYRLALGAPAWSHEERRALRLSLATALVHAGRSAEAGEEYLQLTQAAAGDDRWSLMYQSGEQFIRAGMVSQALEVLAPLFRHHGLHPPRKGGTRTLVGLLCRRAWLSLTGYRVRPRAFRRSGKRIFAQIDLCTRMGGALSFFDHLAGAALVLKGSHLALRSGDDARVALALTFEAVMSALAGKQRRADRFIARVERLVRRGEYDYALAGAFLARGVGLLLDGDWGQALEQFGSTKETVRRCPGKRMEVVQAEWYSQYPLFYSGELRQLAERLSDHLQDTLDCQNYFAAALLRLNIGNLAWLAGDRPEDARRQIDEAKPQHLELSLMLHYEALVAQLRLDLYLGQAGIAWRRLQDEWPWFVRSGRLRMTFWAIEVHHLRATIAVSLMNQGAGDRDVLRALRRSIGYLERQPAAWPRALASLSRAGLLAGQGEVPEAIAMYQTAKKSLAAANLPLYAAAARRRLGELLGEDQLIAQADAALVERGVANPHRFAALLAGVLGVRR